MYRRRWLKERLMGSILNDLRYGIRILRKNPGYSVVAIVVLALGIGANTVIFSDVNAMMIHPFAFRDLDRAVAVWETVPRQNELGISVAPANFRDWDSQNHTFELLAATHGWDVNLTGSGVAERVEGCRVTSDFFRLLGIAPHLGRSIGPGDFAPGKSGVVVLSYRFWQEHLGADPGVVGREVLLNGAKFTVIGVMPADFDFPVGAQAWSPLDLTSSEAANRREHYLQVIGRLRVGVSASQAQADLNTIAARLGSEYPATNQGHGVQVEGLVENQLQGAAKFLFTLMGSAFFILLLACANVTNLNLARATARRKEIALRLALGAGRWRIVRQLLAEGMLLATLAALFSLLLASWGLAIARQSIPAFIVQHIPGLKHLEIDYTVLAFTLGLGLLSGILAALAPAFQSTRTDVNDALKEGGRGTGAGRGGSRLRSLLVAGEVALALVLLVGSVLMVNGFRAMADAYPGYDASHVLTFQVTLAPAKYNTPASRRNFFADLISRLHALPGVQFVTAADSLPSAWSWDSTLYQAQDQPPPAPGEMRTAVSEITTPDYLATLKIPLVKGRFLSAQDGPDAAPVVVISESLARRVWPGQDVLGKHLRLGGKDDPWRTVVGVVADFKLTPFATDVHPTAYVPFAQVPLSSAAVAIRTAGDPELLAAAARSAVLGVDPDQPPYEMRSLAQTVSDQESGVLHSARMMLIFGALALVLAAAGTFAVVAYTVRQRRHEIGVRLALGARGGDMLKLVMIYSAKLCALGLAVGLPCAYILSRLLSSLLFGVKSVDLLALAGITLLLAAAAAVAGYVPARWAMRVDPMEALRWE
jgi:putative ABC transport system permease protein